MSNITHVSSKKTRITETSRGFRYRAFKDKKQIYFPLPLDKQEAFRTADKIREYLKTHSLAETRQEFHPDYRVDPVSVARFREFRLYVEQVVSVANGWSASTTETYIWAFQRVLRFKLGREDVSTFDVFEFEPSWLDEYKLAALKGVEDLDESQSRKRTFNSLLKQVRGLFGPEAVRCYGMNRWHFPWVNQLGDVSYFRRVKKTWVSPDEEVILRTHKLVESLSGDEYVVAAFAFYAGLRKSEIKSVSREWIQRNDDERRIWVRQTKHFMPKGREGFTIIPAHVLDRIERETSSYMRTYMGRAPLSTFTKVTQKLREVLQVEKPLHELRRFFGTFIANADSLWAAQQYLRHGAAQTTFDYYAHSVMSEAARRCWTDCP